MVTEGSVQMGVLNCTGATGGTLMPILYYRPDSLSVVLQSQLDYHRKFTSINGEQLEGNQNAKILKLRIVCLEDQSEVYC